MRLGVFPKNSNGLNQFIVYIMITYNEKVVRACKRSDLLVLQSLFDLDEDIVVPDNDCYDSSSDCGYCDACIPPDPLQTAVRNNAIDIVEAILRHPKFPVTWKTGAGSSLITTAAGYPDGRLFEMLLADDRLFPTHDEKELLSMMTLANINGPDNIWKLTAQPAVMALPEDAVRDARGFVNHRDWANQWMRIKEVREALVREGRCFTWKDVPSEYRVRPAKLPGSSEWLNTVVSRTIGEECLPWNGVCHHMVRVVRNSGSKSTSKVSGTFIRSNFYESLREGQKEHFGLGATEG